MTIVRRAAWVALALAGVSACAAPTAPTDPLAVTKPPPVAERPEPLPKGKESIYTLVNSGNLRDADDILRDVWRVPRHPAVALPDPLTWREDPFQEEYWRFVFYSLRPTSNLLWAYYRTGRVAYRDKLLSVLRSYVAFETKNRRRDPLRVDDPHAIAFRAMVLTNSYVKLNRSGDLPADLARPLLEAIRRVGESLVDPRNFQVSFNHGFSEAVALLLIHVNFPQLDPRNRWRDLAYTRLWATTELTVDGDGVETEKSPFYHFYVFSFALQLQAWAKANHVPLPDGFDHRIRTMVRYATYIIWPDGSVPLMGSSVSLRPRGEADVYAAMMREHPEFAFAVTAGEQGEPPTDRAALFRRSGQVVLRSPVDLDRPYSDNSQVLMDFGPPQGAHSHHEALAFNYYSHGRELIVDSGLDTYSRGEAFTYFHGSTAHNTVVVDGRDQDGGDVRGGLTATGDGWAYQSGVASVYKGVTHRRAVLLLARDLVVVADIVSADRHHTFEQLWHIFPGAHVVGGPTRTSVLDEYDHPALDIVPADLGAPMTVHTSYGALRPMQGWHSSEYGRTEPNHAVAYRLTGHTAVYLTLLASGPYAGRGATITGSVRGDVAAEVCVPGYGAASVHIGAIAARRESVAVTAKASCDDAA